MEKTDIEKLYSIRDVADMLGLSVAYIRKAVYTKQLPYYKFGKIRFRVSDVEAWIKQRKIVRKTG